MFAYELRQIARKLISPNRGKVSQSGQNGVNELNVYLGWFYCIFSAEVLSALILSTST